MKLKEIIGERDEIIGKRDKTIHHQQHRINQLEELIRLQKHRQFGASSEKSSDQGELFDEAELPRLRIEHGLPESDKTCTCGCQLTLIGEECSEQLDIIPAKVRVLVHVRKKYGCKQCEETIKLSPLPLQPIPKSMASPRLLAYIVTLKYQDGLPQAAQKACLVLR